jgi:protein tyrosine phosphatase (PTP) superfamily phosphohydrolase (DUF442 family)
MLLGSNEVAHLVLRSFRLVVGQRTEGEPHDQPRERSEHCGPEQIELRLG